MEYDLNAKCVNRNIIHVETVHVLTLTKLISSVFFFFFFFFLLPLSYKWESPSIRTYCKDRCIFWLICGASILIRITWTHQNLGIGIKSLRMGFYQCMRRNKTNRWHRKIYFEWFVRIWKRKRFYCLLFPELSQNFALKWFALCPSKLWLCHEKEIQIYEILFTVIIANHIKNSCIKFEDDPPNILFGFCHQTIKSY